MLFLVFCVCVILPASFTTAIGLGDIINKLNNPSPVITDESDKAIADGPLQWWQTGVIYQVYPTSSKDSNGDWVGDLKGIEEEAYHFKDLGVAAVCLSPIYKATMVDFGYYINNYTDVSAIFGTMDDFESLKSTLHSLGLKLVLDFVHDCTSDQCVWFEKSVKRIDPYTNYYVWKDPEGWINNKPIPPSNWINVFRDGPAWQYNEERKQFYLHNFATKQPNLNYRCKELVEEMKNILRFWMNKGVDGFRVETIPYLVKHKDFPNEPPANSSKPSTKTEHDSVNHIYTMDNPESWQIVEEFQNTIKDYSDKDNKSRVMIIEDYENFNPALEYYGKNKETDVNMKFNLLLINELNEFSNARELVQTIDSRLDNMAKEKWPAWVVKNHKNPVGTRYGKDLVDGMNMISLMLPGTAFMYSGEEIGMMDTHSSDQADFSLNLKTSLEVNPNYWWLNLEEEKRKTKSHYHIYKSLIQLRSVPTIQRGAYETHALSDWVVAIVRKLEGYEKYVVLVNLGKEVEIISLKEFIKDIPNQMTVHISSVNSEHDAGQMLDTKAYGFTMRPKSALILTTDVSVPQLGNMLTIPNTTIRSKRSITGKCKCSSCNTDVGRPIVTSTIRNNNGSRIYITINGKVYYSSSNNTTNNSNSNLSYDREPVTMTINNNTDCTIHVTIKDDGNYSSSMPLSITINNNKPNDTINSSYPNTTGPITVTIKNNSSSRIDIKIG